MGKASSAKKVARAARAGGNRRPGQRRNLGFPVTMVVVVALGIGLVVYARDNRPANAEPTSQASNPEDFDHWHAAYGFYLCDTFVRGEPGPVDVGEDALGIHTHEDSVIHIHPFIDSAAGSNATLDIFLRQIGIEMDNDTLTFPDGEVWEEGETMCGDQEGRLVIAKWNDARDAESEDPNELITEDFGSIRFRQDLEAYTIAFLPDGDAVPARPGIIASLEGLTDVLDAPDLGGDETEPADGSTTTTVVEDGEDEGDATTTTADEDEATPTTTDG
jgi:hypothetical protein